MIPRNPGSRVGKQFREGKKANAMGVKGQGGTVSKRPNPTGELGDTTSELSHPKGREPKAFNHQLPPMTGC